MARLLSCLRHLPHQSLAVAGVVIAVTFAWAGAATVSEAATAPLQSAPATTLVTPTPAQIGAVMTPTVSGDPLSRLQASLMSSFPQSFGGFYVDKAGQYVVATSGPQVVFSFSMLLLRIFKRISARASVSDVIACGIAKIISCPTAAAPNITSQVDDCARM